MRKIEILDNEERALFDNPPEFTLSEQNIYFTLPDEVANWAKNISSSIALIGFTLLWGYAKSKYRFFHPTQFLSSDIQFICKSIGIEAPTSIDFTNYNQRTYNYHKQIIRKHLQIKPFDKTALQIFIEAIRNNLNIA
jgi:hypothetical protein